MRNLALALVCTLVIAAPCFAGESPVAPLDADEWNVLHAAHLLNRAGFGGTPAEIVALASMSFDEAVAYMVDYERRKAPEPMVIAPYNPVGERWDRMRERAVKGTLRKLRYQARAMLERNLTYALEGEPEKKVDPRRKKRNKYSSKRAVPPADTPQNLSRRFRMGIPLTEAQLLEVAKMYAEGSLRQRYEYEIYYQLRNHWIRRMLTSARPLEEKMTLFWHGHFATSASKVRNPRWLKGQNELLRKHATGSFADLVRGISTDPAMLVYLDGNRNVKGKPNENFARELMELFTIGIGNYTEKDIKEAARAFTGWSVSKYNRGKKKKKSKDAAKKHPSGAYYNAKLHDGGEKTFMGKTGNFTGEDIIRIILERPQTATFICGKLVRYFVGDDPQPALVEALSTTFRESGYRIKPVLRQLFRSRLFYSDAVRGNHIKSPVQLVVGTLRQLGTTKDARSEDVTNYTMHQYDAMMRQMGQHLFHPPNVKGWDGGKAWINAATMLNRYNMTRDLVTQSQRASYYKKKFNPAKRPNRSKKGSQVSLPPLFAELSRFDSPDALIDHLVARLLLRQLPEDRLAKLRATLAPEGEPFDASNAQTQKRILQVVILITSMPEYQLH